MLTHKQLIALYCLFTGDRSPPRATAPTESSISRINSTLGIILPQPFIEFARSCPSYCCGLFASIGEDFDDSDHILSINREFHTGEIPCVPPWLTIINKGHDDDCEGFDTRHRKGNEYSVVYWDASEGLKFDNSAWQVFHSFRDYLEFMVVYYAKTRDEKRAEQIIRAA